VPGQSLVHRLGHFLLRIATTELQGLDKLPGSCSILVTLAQGSQIIVEDFWPVPVADGFGIGESANSLSEER